ncbi:MAG: DUF3150 domain-containing protein [Candidatus Competibacteraceae bacterium]
MSIQWLEQVVFIHLDFHLWSGRKKLRAEDLKNLTAEQMPPATLASLGSKRLCAPDDLAPGIRCRKQAERVCQLYGFRFLGHFAVPEPRLEALQRGLEVAVAEFNAWRSDFLARYEAVIDHWVQQHPGWETIIRRAVEPVESVAARLSAGYQVFRIAPATDQADDSANAGLAAQAATLGDRLLASVAQDAQTLWRESLQGRDQVGRRVLRPVQAILDKLRGWALIDPTVAPIVQRIELALAALPRRGPLQGNDLNALAGLVFLLSDPDRLKQHGQAVLAGLPEETAIDRLETVDAVEPPVTGTLEPVIPEDDVIRPFEPSPRVQTGWFF